LRWGRNLLKTAKMDKKIDQEVYGLYGLTEEDVRAVEGK